MPISVNCYYRRLPTISPTEFKTYMETVHIPLIKEVLGPICPLSFVLQYVERAESGVGDRLGATVDFKKTNPTAPVILVGRYGDREWDVCSEWVFRDELHLHQLLMAMNGEDGQKIKDDEERFTETEMLRVVVMGKRTVM